MKLGTDTGSLVNYMMSAGKQQQPYVGMAATTCGWTDRHPATVVWVSPSGKKLIVQEDNAKRIDNNGMSESQEYEYSPNPNGHKSTYTLRKSGLWGLVGDKRSGGLTLGMREKYHDFSF